MSILEVLEFFNHTFTLFLIFPAILGLGIYLTYKLPFVQIRQLKNSIKVMIRQSQAEGSISRFEAISAVLAGNFGTGNISGMAVALTMGGPGALVWMWVMAFFGAAIQYASCILGVRYRRNKGNNEFVGGPMYYLHDGLGYKKLAFLFAALTIFGSIAVGNFAQINSIILPLESMGFNPLYCSILIAAFVGIVLFGGIKRVAFFASYVVPFKAILYFGAALLIILYHYDQVIPAFKLMFAHAFGFSSIAGGFMGVSVLKALTTGFDRGLFATDTGTGIAPILQASSRSEHPVVDGIATLIAPLMVMIVCTATGLVLIVTGAWQEPGLKSTNMVVHAFTQGLGSSGYYIVLISLILFAYTSILAYAYCGEKATEYLFGTGKSHLFRYVFIALVPLSALIKVEMVWTLADIAVTSMLLINVIAIFSLSRHVIDSSREYQALSNSR